MRKGDAAVIRRRWLLSAVMVLGIVACRPEWDAPQRKKRSAPVLQRMSLCTMLAYYQGLYCVVGGLEIACMSWCVFDCISNVSGKGFGNPQS